MTLIKSISGVYGTIGGRPGDTLNPLEIVKLTSAFARFVSGKKIVVGRDGRISGQMVRNIVVGTLMGMGCDVIDIGYASTPTTELAVRMTGADGGIVITASHNDSQWNGLKLLNHNGEFLMPHDSKEMLALAESEDFSYANIKQLGQLTINETFNQRHIDAVLNLKLVDAEAIRQRKFRVCVDAINSVGGIILPQLFQALGVDFEILNGECTGAFAHKPEPKENNLLGIISRMKQEHFDLGIVVDSDVDRLAFICEDGTMFGEEYTLVSVADYVLSHTPGNTVSNLSSTRALRDVTLQHGGQYYATAIGEANVTAEMKRVDAVIGGDGNGGIIYPECHYGRDALVGIALFLSSLAHHQCSASQLRATFPDYQIAKNHIDLTPDVDVDAILKKVKERFSKDNSAHISEADGLKIDFSDRWVHLRKSNTEPVVRVYSEARSIEQADHLGNELMHYFYDMQKELVYKRLESNNNLMSHNYITTPIL